MPSGSISSWCSEHFPCPLLVIQLLLLLLGLKPSLCNWVRDFLTNRSQSVKIDGASPSTITLKISSPRGCVLRPLLYTLLTHNCSARYPSNHIVKFADDTAVVGLISNNDESVYRREVEELVDWCRANSGED